MATRRYCGRIKPGTICGYCFQRFATGYDHLVPISYGGGIVHSASNLYPSCGRCNSILGNLIFPTVEAKREYVRQKLIKKRKWNLPELQPLIFEDSTASEVLLCTLPMAVLERKPSEGSALINRNKKTQEAVSGPQRPKRSVIWKPCEQCGHQLRVRKTNQARHYCSERCARRAAFRRDTHAVNTTHLRRSTKPR